MKKFSYQLKAFFSTPFGIVILFVVIFYTMTFGVYYFYSPGPEERQQAQQEPKDSQLRATTVGRQVMSVDIKNTLIPASVQNPTEQMTQETAASN